MCFFFTRFEIEIVMGESIGGGKLEKERQWCSEFLFWGCLAEEAAWGVGVFESGF
jgi:hypothetical protein